MRIRVAGHSLPKKHFRLTGIILIACGLINHGIEAFLIIYAVNEDYRAMATGAGFWAGFTAIATGIFGIFAQKKQTTIKVSFLISFCKVGTLMALGASRTAYKAMYATCVTDGEEESECIWILLAEACNILLYIVELTCYLANLPIAIRSFCTAPPPSSS